MKGLWFNAKDISYKLLLAAFKMYTSRKEDPRIICLKVTKTTVNIIHRHLYFM